MPALFKKQIRRAEPHLLEILGPLWPRIVGKAMALHSRPVLFDLGVLTLHADGATWGNQLRYMSEEVRAKVNGFLGQSLVKKLRIKPVTQSGLFAETGRAKELVPPPLRPSDFHMNTNSITDPEVAAALSDRTPNISIAPGARTIHGLHGKRCSLCGRSGPP